MPKGENRNYLKNKHLVKELNIKQKESTEIIISNFKRYHCDLEEIHKFPKKDQLISKLNFYINFIKKIILIILIFFKIFKKDLNNFGRPPKIYNGIKLTEVKTYLQKFNLKKKLNIKLQQISSNIVLIENKNE